MCIYTCIYIYIHIIYLYDIATWAWSRLKRYPTHFFVWIKVSNKCKSPGKTLPTTNISLLPCIHHPNTQVTRVTSPQPLASELPVNVEIQRIRRAELNWHHRWPWKEISKRFTNLRIRATTKKNTTSDQWRHQEEVDGDARIFFPGKGNVPTAKPLCICVPVLLKKGYVSLFHACQRSCPRVLKNVGKHPDCWCMHKCPCSFWKMLNESG